MKRNMGYLKSVQSKWELRFIVCIRTMRTETLINKYCMPRKMLRTPKCIFFNPYKSFVCELQLCLRELRWPSQVLRCAHVRACPVVSNFLWLHWLWPSRRLCPWNFPGKDTGVGCHFLLQGIFPTQGSNLCPLYLLHWKGNFYQLSHQVIPSHSSKR